MGTKPQVGVRSLAYFFVPLVFRPRYVASALHRTARMLSEQLFIVIAEQAIVIEAERKGHVCDTMLIGRV